MNINAANSWHLPEFLVTIFCIIFIFYFCKKLRPKHENDIRIVWYFYSLTVVVSSWIAFYSFKTGAISETGSFEGELGGWVLFLLNGSLNVELSFYLIATIVALILLPQILSYLICGLFFGVASTPRYIDESMDFFSWGMVKTFIVVSGVTTVMPFYFQNFFSWIPLSFAFCALSFFSLFYYRGYGAIVANLKRWTPQPLHNRANRIHLFFTRNCRKEIEIDTIDNIMANTQLAECPYKIMLSERLENKPVLPSNITNQEG